MWLVFHTMKIKFLHKDEHQQFINTIIKPPPPPLLVNIWLGLIFGLMNSLNLSADLSFQLGKIPTRVLFQLVCGSFKLGICMSYRYSLALSNHNWPLSFYIYYAIGIMLI